MSNWVRKLAKPMAALGVLGLLGQSLMLGCISSAMASTAPGTFARATAEQGVTATLPEAGGPGQPASAAAGHDHCGHNRTESRLPPQRDDDCCGWAGLSPFAGGSPARDMFSSARPELKFAALTVDIVAVYRPAVVHEPPSATLPPPYIAPLYLLDCTFLE